MIVQYKLQLVCIVLALLLASLLPSAHSSGAVTPSQCPSGTYASSTGLSSCLACEPGTYQPTSGQSSCLNCPAGFNQTATGTTNCGSGCPIAQYTAATGAIQCNECPPGKYGTQAAQSSCVECAAGTYQDVSSQTSCKSCPATTYTSSVGSSNCDRCLPGTYGNSTGLSACVNCAAGSYQNLTGQSSCVLCPRGMYSLVGALTCTVCPTNSATDHEGSPMCTACGANMQPDEQAYMCICQAGYYMPSYVSGSNNFTCLACPNGADCTQAGTTWANIQTLPGFWRPNNQTLTFYECPFKEYCLGSKATGNGTISGLGSNLIVIDGASACANNRGCAMCTCCLTGYYEQIGGTCKACPTNTSWVANSFIIVAVVALVVLMYWIVLRSGRHLLESHSMTGYNNNNEDSTTSSMEESVSSKSVSSSESSSTEESESTADSEATSEDSESGSSSEEGSSESDSDSDEEEEATDSGSSEDDEQTNNRPDPINKDLPLLTGPPAPPADFTYKLKIFVSFVQIAVSLGSGLNMRWPPTVKTVINYFSVINFDFIFSSVTSSNCFAVASYYNEFLVVVCLPIAGLLLIAGLYLLPRYFECLCYRHASLQQRQRSKMKFWKLFLYTLFLLYPSMSSTVLNLYVCEEVNGDSLLHTDNRVRCGTSQWHEYTLIGIPLIVIYPVGIPAYFFVLLYANRRFLRESRIQAQLGFLYAGYRLEMWWFEIADCLYKLVMTSLLAFLPFDYQLPFAMCIVCLYFMCSIYLNPYIRASDDLLHSLCLTEVMLLVMCGFVFANSDSFSSTDDIAASIAIFAICILFIIVFLWQFLSLACKLGSALVKKWHKRNKLRQAQNKVHPSVNKQVEDAEYSVSQEAAWQDATEAEQEAAIQARQAG